MLRLSFNFGCKPLLLYSDNLLSLDIAKKVLSEEEGFKISIFTRIIKTTQPRPSWSSTLRREDKDKDNDAPDLLITSTIRIEEK